MGATSTRLGWTILAAMLTGSVACGQGAPAATEVDRRWLDTSITPAERDRLTTLVGLAAPEFPSEMRWIGEASSLEGLLGDVVIVQFWTRTDRRGHARIDQLQELRERSGEDLRVVSIHSTAGAAGLEQYLERRPAAVPVGVDEGDAYAAALGARSPLTNLVIDRAGVVRYVMLNPQGLAGAAELLLAEAAPDPDSVVSPPVAERPEPGQGRTPQRGPAQKRRDASGFWVDRIPDEFFPVQTEPVPNADDIRGRKGPPIEVEQWLTRQPDASHKVVVVAFWATWCGPCVASIPHLNALQQKFPDELLVLGVSGEPFEAVRSWMPGKGIRYSIGVDPARRMSQVVRNRSIPHAMVYSPDGVIRWQGFPRQLSADHLGQIVAASRRGAATP